MKIFISHSQKDKDVAKAFKELFVDFARIYPGKQEVFLSSDISEDQIKTGKWKDDFEKNLKDSTHFVVLVTPNSLHSTWVTYEIGYALALEGIEKGIEKIIPIGIKGVSPESFCLSSYNMKNIEDEQDIIDLLNRIFGSTRKFNKIWCKENEESIKKLLVYCTERCVYFVGSEPKDKADNGEWDDDKKTFVKKFLEQLIDGLLDPETGFKGIKVSSFPTVENVGKVVFDKVANKSEEYAEKYEISGLFNLDNLAKDKNINPKTWENTLNGFRRLYLKNKSSMVIIGGNNHTKEELKVAEEFDHLEIFPIPCMGGAAKDIFEEKLEKYEKLDHPCCPCYKGGDYMHKKECNQNQIKTFVMRLAQYKYYADEQES